MYELKYEENESQFIETDRIFINITTLLLFYLRIKIKFYASLHALILY